MKFRLILFIIIIFIVPISTKTNAQLVQVELFNQFSIKTIVIIPMEGKYQLISEQGKLYKLKKNNIIYFTHVGDSISVWDADHHIGLFSKVNLMGTAKYNIFKIESVYPALPARLYEGDITLETANNALKVENYINIDSYLAGVVEAEAGPSAPFEFYKTQAILSRTYLYEIINRLGKNYKIGDDVNFQVYKGMCQKNANIKLAVIHTRGLVIVDSTSQLITAAFHSNSGGSTANSEDVWITSKTYLKQTDDSFSLNQRNTEWEDSVTIADWLNYFENNGFNVLDDSTNRKLLNIVQNTREKYMLIDKDTLSPRKLRSTFKLRSSWFCTYVNGEYVIIKGRGYGHGVGLSQEGAMQMARQNYSFLDIINYYYKNVKVVHINKIS